MSKQSIFPKLAEKTSCSISKSEILPAALAHELQLMGGNTFVNLARRSGVPYREIVGDVISKLGVSPPSSTQVHDKESAVMQHVINQALDTMDPEARAALESELKEVSKNQASLKSLRNLRSLAAGPTMVLVARTVAVQVIKRVGLQGAGKLVGGRALSALAGPVGLVVGGLWTAIDVAGPAYSVTVPSVVIVYLMRTEQAAGDFAAQIQDL